MYCQAPVQVRFRSIPSLSQAQVSQVFEFWKFPLSTLFLLLTINILINYLSSITLTLPGQCFKYLIKEDTRHIIVRTEPQNPRFARLLTSHLQISLEVRVGGVGCGGPGGAPLAEAAHDGGHRQAVPVARESAVDLLHPRLVVRLGPVAALVVRGEVEGVDDSLLISAQAPLHNEGVLVTSNQIKVRGHITVNIPRLAKLS